MLCTKCGAAVKPVVAVDIDGTLGDYHSHFLAFAQSYLGRPLPQSGSYLYNGVGTFREWFAKYGVNGDTWHDIKLAYRQGAQKRSMPAYPYAGELCRQVANAGAELWLTTTRPYLRLDNIDPDTRAWLDRHSIVYDGLIYDELKYARLANLVDPARVVAVVDDLPEMWDAAAAQFGWRVPILRQTQFNRGVVCEQGANGLNGVWLMVEERIKAWKEQYE